MCLIQLLLSPVYLALALIRATVHLAANIAVTAATVMGAILFTPFRMLERLLGGGRPHDRDQ